MSDIPEHIQQYALDVLKALVAVPSVAAEGRGIDEASALTKRLLEAEGFDVALHPTGGAPVVFGHLDAGTGPTVLMYNHYDVQPADPLDLWESDPFELTERDGKLYGRGAADDKGEIVSRLAALKWFKEKHGSLPFSVKFLIEGEEEIGSPNLASYVEAYKDTLAADVAIWEFGGVDAAERPMTYCGLKGILTVELSVRTTSHDLHSSYGAVVENPIFVLSAALASLRDANGRVLIDGFYDDVIAPTAEQLELVNSLPDEDTDLARVFGVDGFIGGVTGSAMQRQLLFEPNVNYNGFHSGYAGMGSKTVLPAEAFAKLDFRLVPDQDPLKVKAQLEAHFVKHGFDAINVTVLEHAERGARSDVTHPWVQETVATLREVYGKEPVMYPNVAGSGPIHPFVEHLGVPVVGIGCGYPGSRIHSPNEHIRRDLLEKGIQSTLRLLERYTLD